jgi:predicted MFS family arabinose efflux permease
MHLSRKEQYGVRLGRYNAYNLFAAIMGYAIVWSGFKFLGLTYQKAFVIASIFYIIAALTLLRMKPVKPEKFKIKFVLRKRYSLYYILSLVNGARKQIFLTFAPWVLIQRFHVTPPVFAMLGLFIATVSIMTRTIVGNAIDRLGEKFVLSAEAILLVVICLGYSFAENIAPAGVAVIILAVCYIIDNSMNAVEMARSTYVRKIALYPDDVTPTLAAGTSFDHIIAMSIPFLGGMLWVAYGYRYVFLAAAFIGMLNFFLSTKIRIEDRHVQS